MLQRPRDSTTITQQLIANIEQRLQHHVSIVAKTLLEHHDTLYITFIGAGLARASAELVYWPLRQLSEKNIRLVSGEEILYHTLPYHEEKALVLLFSEPGTENVAAKIATTTRLTGNNMVLVSTPLPDALSPYLPRERIEISEKPFSLSFIIAASKIVAVIIEKYSSIKIRKNRIINEYTNISQIYDDLIRKYEDTIQKIVSIIETSNNIIVYSSPTMMPASYLFEWCLYKQGIPIRIYNLSAILSHLSEELFKKSKNISTIFLLTDIESDIVREAKFKLSFTSNQRISIAELTIHTDPLTAPLYASLILNNVCIEVSRKENHAKNSNTSLFS